ncbi:Zn finger [Haloarcula tailed virus 2]|uniref:Zn finger n=1 Tax=Haloarcula tailed virus 2 TaxID=2877989 RepID=A0AAE8Y1M5_9CAUD|nr:Zn finger [Haloarcula tailed virus 2]UBF23203.1 Zn finger [Haloarcula tailed virus 2]
MQGATHYTGKAVTVRCQQCGGLNQGTSMRDVGFDCDDCGHSVIN